jgi:hypothetical protein
LPPALGGKADVRTASGYAPALDDIQARRLRISRRSLTSDKAVVIRLRASALPCRPERPRSGPGLGRSHLGEREHSVFREALRQAVVMRECHDQLVSRGAMTPQRTVNEKVLNLPPFPGKVSRYEHGIQWLFASGLTLRVTWMRDAARRTHVPRSRRRPTPPRRPRRRRRSPLLGCPERPRSSPADRVVRRACPDAERGTGACRVAPC